MGCNCGRQTCRSCNSAYDVLFPGSADAAPCNTNDCSSVPQPSPRPYYEKAAVCIEDHNTDVYINQYTAVLRIANSWNIPDCGNSAVLNIKGLKNIPLGAYLWNQRYGYFKIQNFDPDTEQVTVQNNCTSGNSAVGGQVPACSDFMVTDPPAAGSGGGGSGNDPFLAADFTAPLVGASLDITLTSVSGLSIGKSVQIGSGTYLLSAIRSQFVVNITNQGSGIAPGTTVFAENAQGQLQYPVVLIDTNPCTNTPVVAGALLVCANNNTQALAGVSAGMVPVMIDPENSIVQFRALDVPTRTCSALTADVILTAGQGTYTLPIGDAAQISPQDVLQIGSRTDRFTVVTVTGNNLAGTLNPVPTGTAIIPAGTSVCEVECCENLQSELNTLNSFVGSLQVFQAAMSKMQLTAIPGIFYDCIPASGDAGTNVQLVEAAVIHVTAPADRDMHYIAFLDVGILPNHGAVDLDGDPCVTMHEVEVVWSNLPPPRAKGKMAFTDFGSDGYDIALAYPSTFAANVPLWTYLHPFNPSSPPLYPMMWHQNTIVAWSGGIFAGQSVDLMVFYKNANGDNHAPAVVGNTTIRTCGFILAIPAL